MAQTKIPSYDALMNPTIHALKILGGSGTVDEIYNKVVELGKYSDEQLRVLQYPDKGGMTKIEYRLHWARHYLKRYGLLENSSRGVWALTPNGSQLERVDEHEVVKFVGGQIKKNRQLTKENGSQQHEALDTPDDESWEQQLLNVLLNMTPAAFERLIQRILRESGFVQVEVTGRSGDDGIDGKGIMRLGGLLSFHVIFQAKRYKGAVTPSQVRDFRGAMSGRTDKGILITTGTFTREAIREATREGPPPIDLIDGEQLIQKLRDLKLGVKIELVEQVVINRGWFSSI